ncbi:MAG: c-type cytochrome [Williamsia sp.]|nr:c-type cytochrome [Williamsia sp.]
MFKYLLGCLLVLACFSFSTVVTRFKEEKPTPIPPSKQRSGDAAEGYRYLTTGDYVKGGLPYDFYLMGLGASKTNYLKREGLNGNVNHDYSVVKAPNGENLVAPNCMQCHAQVFDSTLIMGLGNTFLDFSNDQRFNPQTMVLLENLLQKSSPQKYQASLPFITVIKTVSPMLSTKVRGVNTADRLTAVLAAHRDPATFKWIDKAQFEIPDEVIPTDVPAWWLLKKKNAMFHNGFGRGDFGRFLMMSNLLTVTDTAESREVDSHFNNVLAYIRSIQPPKYPKAVDKTLAGEGEKVFNNYCSKCHGKYGEAPEYPNLIVPESIIKTDSLLFTSNYQNPQLINWFNNSWFAKGDHPAKLVPSNGYVAPPLDGVWITAPYLHNGSVPTIEALLNSKLRPTYWQRDFTHPVYDYDKLGWVYEQKAAAGNNTVYNTTLKGYGNYGHYFGDKLTDDERKAVIEYLKTL